jgi:alpha-L-fucosidase
MSEKYEEIWSSLKKHRQPEWLDDAKFGIYFHWGVYSVPAWGNEWYPHNMYRKYMKEYKHHVKTYGDPSKFGYKDFIPQFTAEKFDPDEWASLFKQAGAKFAGPVAEHHDGFSMWDSKVNRWNAKNMGPKRDIVGEITEAIRRQGLKVITTFHHAHNWYHYYHSKKYDTGDPEYQDLYGPLHNVDSLKELVCLKTDRPNKEFCEIWFAKCKEVIDNYQPDLIWFDFCLRWIPDNYKRKMVAYYYNKGEEWGKDVEILYKGHDLPPGVGLLDYERGRSGELTHYKWITDTTLGNKSWSYIDGEEFKPMESIVHNFINNISMNGCLLMNFGPKADGEIVPEMRTRLLEMGKWLETNGEAVFNSTPWVKAAEGPTKMKKKGGFSENKEVSYTPQDLRFVTKGNSLYVFTLGWPGSVMTIKSLTLFPEYKNLKAQISNYYLLEDSDIESIELLGNEGTLKWTLTHQGLKIQCPDKKPCEYAYCFKINWA